MQYQITTFAAKSAEKNSDLFGALGIDLRLLVLQLIAFLVLVWALGKWVYPVMIKAIDKRQEAMDAGIKASQDAQKQAEEAEKNIAKELHAARLQADDILASTQKEAAALIADAEEKATRRSENIVKEAQANMTNQLQAAREALKAETRILVAEATERIIEEKIDAKKDAKLIDHALQGAKDGK